MLWVRYSQEFFYRFFYLFSGFLFIFFLLYWYSGDLLVFFVQYYYFVDSGSVVEFINLRVMDLFNLQLFISLCVALYLLLPFCWLSLFLYYYESFGVRVVRYFFYWLATFVFFWYALLSVSHVYLFTNFLLFFLSFSHGASWVQMYVAVADLVSFFCLLDFFVAACLMVLFLLSYLYNFLFLAVTIHELVFFFFLLVIFLFCSMGFWMLSCGIIGVYLLYEICLFFFICFFWEDSLIG